MILWNLPHMSIYHNLPYPVIYLVFPSTSSAYVTYFPIHSTINILEIYLILPSTSFYYPPYFSGGHLLCFSIYPDSWSISFWEQSRFLCWLPTLLYNLPFCPVYHLPPTTYHGTCCSRATWPCWVPFSHWAGRQLYYDPKAVVQWKDDWRSRVYLHQTWVYRQTPWGGWSQCDVPKKRRLWLRRSSTRQNRGQVSTVCLGPTNIFLYFQFLCLVWHVIEMCGWDLSTVQRRASNS